jgi:hypothetical protein
MIIILAALGVIFVVIIIAAIISEIYDKKKNDFYKKTDIRAGEMLNLLNKYNITTPEYLNVCRTILFLDEITTNYSRQDNSLIEERIFGKKLNKAYEDFNSNYKVQMLKEIEKRLMKKTEKQKIDEILSLKRDMPNEWLDDNGNLTNNPYIPTEIKKHFSRRANIGYCYKEKQTQCKEAQNE